MAFGFLGHQLLGVVATLEIDFPCSCSRDPHPSSLAWLIKKYSHALGEILSLNRKQQVTAARLAKLETEAAALRAVLSIHEVKIDPTEIRPKRPRKLKKLLPYGETLRLSLDCLRRARGKLKSTDEIVMYVIANGKLDATQEVMASLHQTIRNNLKKKVAQGVVESQHVPPGNGGFGMGYWRISQ